VIVGIIQHSSGRSGDEMIAVSDAALHDVDAAFREGASEQGHTLQPVLHLDCVTAYKPVYALRALRRRTVSGRVHLPGRGRSKATNPTTRFSADHFDCMLARQPIACRQFRQRYASPGFIWHRIGRDERRKPRTRNPGARSGQSRRDWTLRLFRARTGRFDGVVVSLIMLFLRHSLVIKRAGRAAAERHDFLKR
jgi:hypothetical protein